MTIKKAIPAKTDPDKAYEQMKDTVYRFVVTISFIVMGTSKNILNSESTL